VNSLLPAVRGSRCWPPKASSPGFAVKVPTGDHGGRRRVRRRDPGIRELQPGNGRHCDLFGYLQITAGGIDALG